MLLRAKDDRLPCCFSSPLADTSGSPDKRTSVTHQHRHHVCAVDGTMQANPTAHDSFGKTPVDEVCNSVAGLLLWAPGRPCQAFQHNDAAVARTSLFCFFGRISVLAFLRSAADTR